MKYTVTIPIAGAMHIDVEADSEEDAELKAWDRIHESECAEKEGEIEWEFFSNTCEGNVCRVSYSKVEVSKNGN